MTKRLWIAEYRGNNNAIDVEVPNAQMEESNLVECLASDVEWALYEGEYDALDAMCDRTPGWKVTGHPRAGKFVDAGGAEIYVNDDAEVVETATEVLTSIPEERDDILEIPEEDREGIAEDRLESIGRVF